MKKKEAKGNGLLEWICHLTTPHAKGTEHIPFTNTLRSKCVRSISASILEASVIALHCRLEPTVGPQPLSRKSYMNLDPKAAVFGC